MDFLWILLAFLFGLSLRLISLPPLIGYLIAGFALNYMGIVPSNLDELANIGITLMLFTIGLKLNITDLLKKEVLTVTSAHMLIWTVSGALLILALATTGVALLAGFDFMTATLVTFALSFSSTVCIVKVLEENGELKSRHGKITLGILVIQDIIAVIFLVIATGKQPSIFAFALLLLPLARPLFGRLLEAAGHGELLPLTGFIFAFGSYELFNLVNIKGDLGALIAGLLISQHAKSTELAKSLLHFKDLFLIGFFLTVGLTALPNASMFFTASMLLLLIPLKFLLFYFLGVGLKLRGRTAFLSSLMLTNYSEFGLIVAALCMQQGWLDKEWLVIMAISVSMSFVLTSIIYRYAHTIYYRYNRLIKRFESDKKLKEDIVFQPKSAEILVIGLGRVGKGAYNALCNIANEKIWGMDADRERVRKLQKAGQKVFYGDGEDADLWENIDLSNIKLILLALPSTNDSLNVAEQLSIADYKGKLVGIARYHDQSERLKKSGIDHVYNFYTEAGTAFAEESLSLIGSEPIQENEHW